jgi:HlyD family secretion protein
MKRVLIAVAALGVLGASIGFLAVDRGTDSATYRFVPIERGDIESTVSATGTVNAVRTVQVGTQVSGQIAALYADFNDHVRRGQLIAKLDPTLLEQAVRQAEADLARTEADVSQNQFTLDQTKPLYDSQAVTESEYRTAQYNLAVSKANLVSSQAALERAQQNLKYTSIYAPIDGIVIERDVDVGQTVAASLSAPQLFLIAEDLAHMQILVSVDESDIGQIKDGQTATFTVQAYPSRTFTGTVRQVRLQSRTSENVVNYTVVVEVANPDGVLLPGMTATVSFQVAKATDVLKVANAALRFRPTEAMQAAVRARLAATAADSARAATPADSAAWRARVAQRAGGATVPRSNTVAQLWYVDANGQLAVTRVRTGITDGQTTAITGPGIREGMEIITSVTSSSASTAVTASPFQSTQQQGRPRPGGF